MPPTFLFAAESGTSGIGALGVDPKAFIIQLVTFIIVFWLLQRYAFKPIVKMLEERRKVIDDGVKMGEKLAKQRAKLDEEVAKAMREARGEADRIIATGHKESREILREAEKAAQRKSESMLADAEVRIHEESERAQRKLEKDIVGLISEATEAIVGEKVDPKKDREIIDKILKGRKSA